MNIKLEPLDDNVVLHANDEVADEAGGSRPESATQRPSRKKTRLEPGISSRKAVQNVKKELEESVVVKKEYENQSPLVSVKDEDKKIKTERALSENVLQSRLREIQSPPFNPGLPEEVLKFAVPREFISSIYGGNPQETFPLIGKHFLDKHGLNDFMFPNLDFNPAAPRAPGEPGLFFKTTPERQNKKNQDEGLTIYRVIARLEAGKWLYMGQYSLTETRPLTVAEWAEQKPIFHNTWCHEICKRGYGQKVLKRMAARERFKCKEPTEDQLFAIEESGEWRNKVMPDDVQHAFARGEEKFVIFKMVCCGYDTDFQKNLYERFKTWAPPTKSSGKTKNKKGGEILKPAAKPKKAVKAGLKRKREEVTE